MTQSEYNTWVMNYMPHKWRGLSTAMKQGYVLLDFRTEHVFSNEGQLRRHVYNGLFKPYKRPKIHDGYIIVPLHPNNRFNPPNIKLTVYKIEK